MLPLLTSLVPGKAMLYTGVAMAALSIGGYMLHSHDVGILTAQAAKEKQVALDELRADQAKAFAALQDVATAAQARAASSATIRSQIIAAPATTACAASPAIRAALGGLRNRAVVAGGNPAGDPVKPAVVQPGAGGAH